MTGRRWCVGVESSDGGITDRGSGRSRIERDIQNWAIRQDRIVIGHVHPGGFICAGPEAESDLNIPVIGPHDDNRLRRLFDRKLINEGSPSQCTFG